MLGEDRQSLYGQTLSRFISPKDQDIFYKHFRVLIAAKLRRCCELWMRRRNGEFFWAKLECVPKEQGSASNATIRIALHDITDSKLLETEIINAKKFEATAHFAGGIAHDFNNLLAVILGNLELVQSEIPSDQSIAQLLQAAQSAGLSAADLTSKFLRFAEGGQPVKKPAAIETLIVESATLSCRLKCAFRMRFPRRIMGR
jgi:signal transduction histidine kinase